MNFEKYTSQLNKASKANSLYTGVANLKVLGINPTQDQLAEILGDADKAHKFDTNYTIKENLNNIPVRPINIWVQDVDENTSPILMSLELADKEQSAQNTDSVRVINNYLQTTWSASVSAVTSNPKMSWFSDTGIRVAKIGEENYYRFVSTLVRYDLQGEQSFMNFLTDNSLDVDSVYGGNFDGLRGLVQYAANNNFVFAAPLVVKEKETDEGTRFYQEVLNKPDFWYRSTVDGSLDWVADNFKEKALKKEEEGYPINRLYTYEFTTFDKEKCVNSAPEEETPTVSSWA